MLAAGEIAVGEKRDARQPEFRGVVAGFGQDARTERERRHAERETAIAPFECGKIGVTASHRQYSIF